MNHAGFIAKTAIVHPGVKLGKDVVIEDYCIIGMPFKGSEGFETVIGDGSRIRAMTIIYAGNVIGAGFQTGNKANIREFNKIGRNVSIGTLSVVEHHVEIGDDVRIHTQAFIPEYSVLKNGVWVGPNVVFTNARVPMAPNAKETLQGPVIETRAIIGANSTLLPGVRIGAGALIGAGSVVTKDIEASMIAFGQPAVAVRKRDDL